MMLIIAGLLACVVVLFGALAQVSPGKLQSYRDSSGKVVPGSISEKIRVNINGLEQGMFIKGKNHENPVLLFLHGGPGMPTYFLEEEHPVGLEGHFTVCYWEQRGGGLSYSPHLKPETITPEQLIADTIEVTNYLRNRFGKEKIYLMGHSWGSFIGIQAAAQAPELYNAYIGVAQISRQAESERLAYTYMLGKYAAQGNTGRVREFKRHPILDSSTALLPYFKSMLRDEAMHELGVGTMHNMKSIVTGVFWPVMLSRSYTLGEKMTLWRAKLFLRNSTKLVDSFLAADMPTDVPRVDVPCYLISGRHDLTVNVNLSRDYLETLQAPIKGFYTFMDSAHSPMHEEPELFMKVMREDVLTGTTSYADVR